MKLQDQVCTLEQAKRLAELGVVQGGSTFYFDKHELFINSHTNTGYYHNPQFCFSAFTVAELGVMPVEVPISLISKTDPAQPQTGSILVSQVASDAWDAALNWSEFSGSPGGDLIPDKVTYLKSLDTKSKEEKK